MKVKTLPKRVDAKAKFSQAKPLGKEEKQNTEKREDEGESECERIHKGDDQLGRKQGT